MKKQSNQRRAPSARKRFVLKSINRRIPVKSCGIHDANRKLMIKFKYECLTSYETEKFHEDIKKLIYKAMHTNNVMMEWDDVYQEIWKKIVKCKHTWNENKGTYVSTWITIVANSVINTIRKNVNKRNSRYFLYDDITGEENNSDQDMADVVAFSNAEDTMHSDNSMKKLVWEDQYNEFLKMLDDTEKIVFDGILSMQEDFLDAYDKNTKPPYSKLKKALGYDDSMLGIVLYNIKKKYSDFFGVDFRQEEASKNEESNGNLRLF